MDVWNEQRANGPQVIAFVRCGCEEEPRIVNMSNAELRAQTAVLKEKLSQGATLDELLPYAFAVVRETANTRGRIATF
jgi:preprotein translocase subunit SecA